MWQKYEKGLFCICASMNIFYKSILLVIGLKSAIFFFLDLLTDLKENVPTSKNTYLKFLFVGMCV